MITCCHSGYDICRWQCSSDMIRSARFSLIRTLRFDLTITAACACVRMCVLGVVLVYIQVCRYGVWICSCLQMRSCHTGARRRTTESTFQNWKRQAAVPMCKALTMSSVYLRTHVRACVCHRFQGMQIRGWSGAHHQVECNLRWGCAS